MGLDVTGLGSIADLIKSGIERIWPNKTEQEKAQAALLMAQLEGEIRLAEGQLKVNEAEATAGKGGWRTFTGYVCGVALAAHYLVFPMLTWICALFGKIVQPPTLDIGNLMTLLLGMLGLGGLKTFEKTKGVR